MTKQRARVRVKGSLTNEAVIGRGTRQMLAFSCIFQHIRRIHAKRCAKRLEQSYPCGRLFIKIVRYADGQVTTASSVEGIQHMMDKMQETSAEYGIKFNITRPG